MAEDIKFTDLNSIRVAKPCPASWNDMQKVEGERVRHCDKCHLNVYNLSEMTRREAVQLVQEHQGRLCVQFYKRKDGTILTQDCPVGEQTAQRTFLKHLLRVLVWPLYALLSLPPIYLHERIRAFTLIQGEADREDECPADLKDIWLESTAKERERRKQEFEKFVEAKDARRYAWIEQEIKRRIEAKKADM